MGTSSELGDFLENRRDDLRPEDAGLTLHTPRRRVPGLRREELAMLAGVSVTHYTRPEQGRVTSVSDSVLGAIARALRLTDDETAHLMDLARPTAARHCATAAADEPEHAPGSAVEDTARG